MGCKLWWATKFSYALLLTQTEISLSAGFNFLFGLACVVFWATIISKLGGMRFYRLGARSPSRCSSASC